MAGWFNTQLPDSQTMVNLIEKGNTLKALSNSMGDMMDIVDNRAKEKYTTTALEQLKGAKSMQDVMNLGLDTSKMTKAGYNQYTNNINMMSKIAEENRANERLNLAIAEDKRSAMRLADEQAKTYMQQATNEAAADRLTMSDKDWNTKWGNAGGINKLVVQDALIRKQIRDKDEAYKTTNQKINILKPFVESAIETLRDPFSSAGAVNQANSILNQYQSLTNLKDINPSVPNTGVNSISVKPNKMSNPTSTGTVNNITSSTKPVIADFTYESIGNSIQELQGQIDYANKFTAGKKVAYDLQQKQDDLKQMQKWFGGVDLTRESIINSHMNNKKNPITKDLAAKKLNKNMSNIYNAISNSISAFDTDGAIGGSWNLVKNWFTTSSTKNQQDLFYNNIVPQAIENFYVLNGRSPTDDEVVRMLEDTNSIEEGMVDVFGKTDVKYTKANKGKISPMGYAVAQVMDKFLEQKRIEEEKDKQEKIKLHNEQVKENIEASKKFNQKFFTHFNN